jgi:hypothetical protein
VGQTRAFYSFVVLGLALSSTLGCARLHALRGGEPATRPAAADDEIRPSAPDSALSYALNEDNIVRVVAGATTCTGALIESDRVLTAHHCVAARDARGDILSRDVGADEVTVEIGGDYLPWAEIGVRAIVAPRCGHATGDGDIAILVLEHPLVGVPVLKRRVDQPPVMGEAIDPVGFGRCAASHDGIRRKHRRGGKIESLAAGAFRTHAAICPGDSGGPALSRTGKAANGTSCDDQEPCVIGVVSASAMDGKEETRGNTEFTRLDRWMRVFSNAKEVAEGASIAELPPIDCKD